MVKQVRQRAGRRNNEARGTQQGNKRGKEAQLRRRTLRNADPRYQASMSVVRKEQLRLERLAELSHEGPAAGAAYAELTRRALNRETISPVVEEELVATPTKREQLAAPIPVENPRRYGDIGWTLGQARSMLRQGYRLDMVVQRTGWGPDWFDDLPLDEDGYGLSTEAWINEIVVGE